MVSVQKYTFCGMQELTRPTGLKGLMIGAASGTAETPRAHITNMAALGMQYGDPRAPEHELILYRMLERHWLRRSLYESCT